jgi:hypothetical protein
MFFPVFTPKYTTDDFRAIFWPNFYDFGNLEGNDKGYYPVACGGWLHVYSVGTCHE